MATAVRAVRVFALLASSVWVSRARAGGLCSDGGAFHSLVASANASGHWTATLDLEKDSRIFRSADDVQLDVRPVASLCGDVRTIAMTVELRGSRPITFIATTPATDTAESRLPPPHLGYARAPTFPGFYKVHQERVNWQEAKAACEAEGAHLVIVNSQEEASALVFLIHSLAPSLTKTLHAGFFATNTDFFTVFGERASDGGFSKWAIGEPKPVDICGAIDHAANLNDVYCSRNVKRSFVCEFGGPPSDSRGAPHVVHQPRPTILPPAGVIRSLKVQEEDVTWAEAHAACQRAGGHLAALQSEAEAAALKSLVAEHPLPPLLHVGLFAESHFVTVFGDDLSDSGYHGWAQGEPNNSPCVVRNLDGSLSTVGCALKTAFLCAFNE